MTARIRRIPGRRLVALTAAVLLPAVAGADLAVVEPNVEYGREGDAPLLLDVYRPATTPPGAKRPAVMLIHGGGWQGGSRTSPTMVALGHALAKAGYLAFSVEYRLVKQGPDGKSWVNQYPIPIDDCRRAVRWVRENADKYGVDPAKIGAVGDSAGGHLVAMLGTSDAPGEPSSRVQAVVDVFGPVDLTGDFTKQRIGETSVQQLIDAFVPTPDAKQEASPLLHIDDKAAACLIFHGTEDPLVPVHQSRDFDAALKKAGRTSEYVEFVGAGHGFIGKEWDELVSKTISFFDAQLKGKSAAAGQPVAPSATPTPAPVKPAQVDLGALFKMHYTNRVRSFQEQNLVYQNVVLLGDSITEGFDVVKLFPRRRVLNRGIGADVIGNALADDDNRGVLKRLDESVFDCSPTDVFLLIGINDLGSGRTPEVMETGYRQLLQQIKSQAPRVKVHVQSLLPCRGNYAKHNANVVDFNDRLRKLADEFGYPFVDLHALTVDDVGELKAEFTNDGLHLNAAGYQPWKAEIERLMRWE